jgi:microcystin-dependent protein
MGQPFIGEIRMFGGNFAPAGWAFCDGAIMNIADNDPLFQLIGTTYGGDGVSTFGLPDLRGRVPIHMGTSSTTGTSYVEGQNGGVEQVTLTTQQIPVHSHALVATTNLASLNAASGAFLAQPQVMAPYFGAAGTQSLNASSIGQTGGSQPHSNFQPYLCISFIISLFGVFPSIN